MTYLDDLQDQQDQQSVADDVSNSGLRPETTDYLNNLAGIGTQAYLAMRDPDLPEYQDWRDSNFASDDSGNYLSREGQSYTDDQLEHMHGFLSRQAGNPFVSGLFDGPDSPIADYMVWRNQNFSNDHGAWEDDDGSLYSEQALQRIFADKSAAQPKQESNQGTQQQPFTLPTTNNVEEFFGGQPRFNPKAASTANSAPGNPFGIMPQEGFQVPDTDDTEQFFGGRQKFYPKGEPSADQNTGAPNLNFTRQKPPAFLPALSASVGLGQPNRRSDVLLVQRLYNQMLNEGRLATVNRSLIAPPLKESGVYDAATADAVRAVQQRNFNGPQNPFGIVTPDGSLFKTLAETATGPNSAVNWISPEMQETARIMLPNAPQKNLNTYLPPLLKALQAVRPFRLRNADPTVTTVTDPAMLEYSLATINAETANFTPISEQPNRLNTTPGGQPFDRYENRENLCNDQPGDGARFKGRGFVQLTGRCNYTDMTDWLKSRNINVDLVKNPDLANDVRYAPAIFAHFLEQREPRIRNALGANSDPKVAGAAFEGYLEDTYDRDPTLRQALDTNEFVRARVPVNGHNRTGVPVNGLPRYLPSLRFGRAYGEIANAMQQNPKWTLGDVAQKWTEGDDAAEQAAFIQGVENTLGVARETKVADLSGAQLQKLKNAQLQYEQQVIARMEDLLNAKQ